MLEYTVPDPLRKQWGVEQRIRGEFCFPQLSLLKIAPAFFISTLISAKKLLSSDGKTEKTGAFSRISQNYRDIVTFHSFVLIISQKIQIYPLAKMARLIYYYYSSGTQIKRVLNPIIVNS